MLVVAYSLIESRSAGRILSITRFKNAVYRDIRVAVPNKCDIVDSQISHHHCNLAAGSQPVTSRTALHFRSIDGNSGHS